MSLPHAITTDEVQIQDVVSQELPRMGGPEVNPIDRNGVRYVNR